MVAREAIPAALVCEACGERGSAVLSEDNNGHTKRQRIESLTGKFKKGVGFIACGVCGQTVLTLAK